MSNLVIVESPAKAKTIAKYLNSNSKLKNMGRFDVVSSMGHVRDLKKKELGIDVNNNFKPFYEVTMEKTKLVDELKKKAAAASMIWLASDYDREGESIAMHLKEVLKLKKYKRITFTEITPKALETAVQNPRQIDDSLVDAQETRRILDRLVGFKLSPLLWKRYKTNMATALSAGRVQSAVMHIILQREHDIEKFTSETYWYFFGDFKIKLGKSEVHDLNEVKLYQDKNIYKINDMKTVSSFLKKIKNEFSIQDVRVKETKKNPDMPFITSSLQQDAYSKLGFGIKHTMKIAQELYEQGFITYMRTDSYAISEDFKSSAEAYIKDTYGEHYYSGGLLRKKTSKNAQEAHEAIRPTDVNTLAASIKLGPDHTKLYDMIWKRTVAFFMKACVYDELEVKIVDSSFKKDALHFISSISKIKFNGFMIVYGASIDEYDFQSFLEKLKSPATKVVNQKVVAKNTWQSPPQRFNDSSIIKTLESEGIGRPSTYAGILTKLIEKQYIIKSDIQGQSKDIINFIYQKGEVKAEKGSITVGSEKSKLVPTDIGREIDKFLETHFEYIVNKDFTANMEADLDNIATGNKSRLHVLNTFWKQFGKDVAAQEKSSEKKVKLDSQNVTYTIDGKDYIVRLAKYGPVIQYKDEETNSKRYINLKPFLKYHKKEFTDISEDDIIYLMSMPKPVGKYNGKVVEVWYGPYGFYLKHDGANIKLPYKLVLRFAVNEEVTADELKAAILYSQNKDKEKDNDNQQTSKKGLYNKKSKQEASKKVVKKILKN